MSLISVEQLLKSGVMHHQAGRLGEAEGLYRQVLGAQPGNAHAEHYLGLLLHQKGDAVGALEHLRRAMALSPSDARYAGNTAQVMLALGRAQEAIDLYRKSLAIRPGNADAHYQLGLAHAHLKQFDRASACYRKAVEIQPAHAAAWNSLGLRLADENQLDEAMKCYERALAADAQLADAHNNIGRLLHDSGKLDEAVAAYQRALAIWPDRARVLGNLASAMKDMGEIEEAVALNRRALELGPDPRIGSNLLYAMLFSPTATTEQLRAEHEKWNRMFVESIRTEGLGRKALAADQRRLRIGYVSPDFRGHPIGRFILPLLEHHDHGRFKIYCYSDVRRGDEVTRACRSAANVWRDTAALDDEQLADLIRRDSIDILVDLTMHMEGNRLLAFARKPAPVQVTYLAYCGTTGLDAIGYRLSDPYLDPHGGDESGYSEKTVRLRSYWCYAPPADAPEVGPAPVKTNGYVTFGCLNNYCKITPDTWAAWIELLRRVPDSRLVVHAHQGSHRERARKRLADAGIDPERLEFVAGLPLAKYLAEYRRIDVGLDPFPYPGGTTTCDALWMGVPVVTLMGRTAISRGGLSVMENLGMGEWIARDAERYVELAVSTARNVETLSAIRAGLRERMRGSVLMDGPAFARDMEAAMRRMWEESA